MSTRDSRYWTEQRLMRTTSRLLDVLGEGRVALEGPVLVARFKEAKDEVEEALHDMQDNVFDSYADDNEGMCAVCGMAGYHPDEDCPDSEADPEDDPEADPEADPEDDREDGPRSSCCKAPMSLVLGELRCEQCGERHRDEVRTRPQRWNED